MSDECENENCIDCDVCCTDCVKEEDKTDVEEREATTEESC